MLLTPEAKTSLAHLNGKSVQSRRVGRRGLSWGDCWPKESYI
jgi:hypothetical protein